MLSRAGLNRLAGPRPGLLLMLAANAPDADAISWIGGATAHLRYHRGHTHAWAFVPLMALLPVLIAWAVERWFPGGEKGADGGKRQARPLVLWKAWLASMIGVSSHLLLDWTNAYGIRTLLPLSSEWFALNITFVIDPWIWGVLTLAVAAPFLSSLVGSEIGAPKKPTGQGWAIFALLFIMLYNGGRYIAHERAMEVLSARIYNGENPRRVGAFPDFLSPFQWNAVVELPGSYWVSRVNLLQEFDPGAGRIFHKARLTPQIEAARATEPFQVFQDFNQWPLWRATPMPEPEGAVKVELLDLRFGDPVNPGFIAEGLVTPAGNRVEEPRFHFSMPRVASR